MFGVKRPRDEDLESELDIQRKAQKCSPAWNLPSFPTQPSHFRQSFPLQPPILTPVNSCDEDEYFSAAKPNLSPSNGITEYHLRNEWNPVGSTTNHATVKPLAALQGSWPWPDNGNSNHTQASLPAISHHEFNRSLRINENPTTHTLHPHLPTAMPLSDAVMKDTNSMEYAGHATEEHYFIPATLPSPISDNDDVTMGSSPPKRSRTGIIHAPFSPTHDRPRNPPGLPCVSTT
ncbi:uncharacterized protein N7483_003833 [Penicillium malachiteum]|uniref:uncharacterized protein n=1 Tax=Penicillium malachiteum TaxID=1324776 RepID=UPI0025494342|nr:uncharacterized protein N7483_003833 [Penicillium malachiteum]KAJ5729325.1 hypothetical protein N7483_003833 [Penicillium malachiteum]